MKRVSKRESGTRVVFVNHTAELGGGEIALLELIRHLDRSRVEPVVVLFGNGPLVALLREIAEVHVLSLSTEILKASKDRLGVRSLVRGGTVIAGLRFLFRLRSLLRSLQADVVYTNSLKADVLGGVAGRLAGLPVIWHVRDRIEADYLPQRVVLLFRGIALFIPRYIVANSAATLATLRHCGKASRGARVIHDGVDPAKYEVSVTRSAGEAVTVGLIGRISPWKGQDVFLEAVRLLHGSYPCARFEVIGVATFGEVMFEAKIRQMQQDSALRDIVQFTGFEANIPERLRRLDIVVHASTLPEPFGQVIIEGMAAGRPVIATDGGGVTEILVDGLTGLLVPMRDAAAMAGAMARLLDDADLRQTMGAAGQARVQQSFTIFRTAKAVETLCIQARDDHSFTTRRRKKPL